VNLFKKRQIPQTYQSALQPAEVVDLFTRLTLHHQAALLRLISRNLVINTSNGPEMGYDFDYNVDGALIVASPSQELDQTANSPSVTTESES
tara:strand:+ start:614 stop:889 length:276 start_codon:yes stop_codon:yes gene_type:complete